ncbi:hypothetical protein BJAS_P3451 [Bathymodiolus japonicus methanotrophic gill symbiont]|uniref:hypothetical protein n=1 Tax=Bathymodiolus japonicus methanotrophic gill symbiont TaxID=113269 RepID=UPI001B51E83A|nr:hypothetical protein [Bathymodiolus japonicus methanotrophic gill symbiont]GFO72914.1 hypothetical protein BJAS_P3451 [Bathymodiolus japonicus methanotrophic gill symbiont]
MRMTQRNFTAGEVSDEVSQRADLDWYNSALLKCENAYIRSQGGVYNREGTYFTGEITGPDLQNVRLIPFSFNKIESFILVFHKNKMEVIANDSFIKIGNNRFSLPHPFDNPKTISYSPFGDTLTLTDGKQIPQLLSRDSSNVWSISPLDFSIRVDKPSSIDLVYPLVGPNRKGYAYAVTAVDNQGRESLEISARTGNVPALSTILPVDIHIKSVHTKADIPTFNVYKALSEFANVYGFIGSATNDHTFGDGTVGGYFQDFNYAPDMSLSPPIDNYPFNNAGDRPYACGFYQQRRIFASTDNNPQGVYCTEAGDIESMRSSKPSQATDAIQQTIVSGTVNIFRNIIDLGGLLLLSAEGEIRITEGQDFVLTPQTFGSRQVSAYGSSSTRPVIADQSIIMTQEQGGRLIAFETIQQSIDRTDNLVASDLSIRSKHLIEGKNIVQMSYAKEPYKIIWCVLDDGTVIGLTYDKENKVWAFHRHTTDGYIQSVASIPRNNITTTYYVVRRRIGTADRYFVERQVAREDKDINNCFYVDCGLSFNGTTPVDNISGLSHLESETVTVLADGNVEKGHVVSGGAIKLRNKAKVVHVGLPYETTLRSMPIASINSTLKGRKKAVNAVHLELYRTRGVMAAQTGGKFTTLKPSKYSDIGSAALKTGEFTLKIANNRNETGTVDIKHDYPLPFCLLSLTTEFDNE